MSSRPHFRGQCAARKVGSGRGSPDDTQNPGGKNLPVQPIRSTIRFSPPWPAGSRLQPAVQRDQANDSATGQGKAPRVAGSAPPLRAQNQAGTKSPNRLSLARLLPTFLPQRSKRRRPSNPAGRRRWTNSTMITTPSMSRRRHHLLPPDGPATASGGISGRSRSSISSDILCVCDLPRRGRILHDRCGLIRPARKGRGTSHPRACGSSQPCVLLGAAP